MNERPHENLNDISEDDILRYTNGAIKQIKIYYGLELNNFEYLKIRKITKEVLEHVRDFRNEFKEIGKLPSKEFNKKFRTAAFNSLQPVTEIEQRFFMDEYGAHPDDFPRENEMIPEDFIKHLKILQKKNREQEEIT